MNGSIGRNFVYEPRFETEATAIDGDFHRMDEAMMYVEAVLRTDPEFGLQTATPPVWVAPIVFAGETTSGAQAASIFYTFDDERVRLLSIRRDW
jgi:hypothetical protein